METFSERAKATRNANQQALAAFGATTSTNGGFARTIREGSGPTVFTVGYERRDGEGLMAVLREAGVDCLVDVRERPWSRRADFRLKALQQLCEGEGIEYQSWPTLGSTGHQRDQLRESGDFSTFRKRFRDLMQRSRRDALDDLADAASDAAIALLCYERAHEECHRSIIADLLGEHFDVTIVALA